METPGKYTKKNTILAMLSIKNRKKQENYKKHK